MAADFVPKTLSHIAKLAKANVSKLSLNSFHPLLVPGG